MCFCTVRSTTGIVRFGGGCDTGTTTGANGGGDSGRVELMVRYFRPSVAIVDEVGASCSGGRGGGPTVSAGETGATVAMVAGSGVFGVFGVGGRNASSVMSWGVRGSTAKFPKLLTNDEV